MKKAKRLLVLLLTMVMLLAVTACGGGNDSGDNNTNGDKQNELQETFDEQMVLSQLDVTEYRTTAEKYTYASVADGERQLVYHVKNNSNFHVKLTFKITTYNAENEVGQILHEEIGALEKGTETVLKCTRMEEYQSCEYEIKVEEVAIKESVNIPVKLVGLGEKMEDMIPFDIENYIYGLFKDMI